jgi:hypothetical protein
MFVQQIPCAQTSTSDLVANTGMSGLGARRIVRMRAPVGITQARRMGVRGLGCPMCPNGLGTLGDGTGLFGTGLFSSGFDFSQWGLTDWAAAALGGYIAISVFSTTKHVARVTRRKVRAVAKA